MVGRVVGGADAGKAAFAIAIDPQTGQVHVAQYLSLQHPTGGSSYDESIQLATNTVQVVVSLKDGDGDTISATGADVSGQIRFQDDGPTAPTVVANANTVTHDETAGVQVAGDPNASNDVAGSTATIFNGVADTEAGVFAGVANKGSDADVTAKDTGAIGFATNARRW